MQQVPPHFDSLKRGAFVLGTCHDSLSVPSIPYYTPVSKLSFSSNHKSTEQSAGSNILRSAFAAVLYTDLNKFSYILVGPEWRAREITVIGTVMIYADWMLR